MSDVVQEIRERVAIYGPNHRVPVADIKTLLAEVDKLREALSALTPNLAATVADLEALQGEHDRERAHGEADDILLTYINEPQITEAYDKIKKWYA